MLTYAHGRLIALFFCVVVGLAWFDVKSSPNPIKNDKNQSTAEKSQQGYWNVSTDPALDFFTGLVAIASLLLALIANKQIRDGRAIQRAQLGARPAGLHEMTDKTIIAWITYVNAGNLPANKVREDVRIGWFDEGEKKDFEEIKITRGGFSRWLPKAEIERGTSNLTSADEAQYRAGKGFVYVWGRIEYEDGFGCPRWTTFCHRYNCAKPEILRHHHYGNDGN